MAKKSEIIFVVEDDPEGGLTAHALGESIFTEADSLEELKDAIRDSLRVHYVDEADIPPVIRLHQVRDEVVPYA